MRASPTASAHAVTPDPQVVVTGAPVSIPAASNSDLIASSSRYCPSSSNNSENGRLREPGMCPARRPLRGSGASPANLAAARASRICPAVPSAMPSRSRSMVTTPTPMAGREVNDPPVCCAAAPDSSVPPASFQAVSPPFRIDTCWWPNRRNIHHPRAAVLMSESSYSTT